MNDLTSTQPLPASVLVTPVIRRMVLVNERAINDMKLGNVVMNDTRLMSRTEDEVMSCQCNYGGKDGGNVVRRPSKCPRQILNGMNSSDAPHAERISIGSATATSRMISIRNTIATSVCWGSMTKVD